MVVVEYDPAWQKRYEIEAERITSALGDLALALHHIGSTSVPGLCAKPIVDMLLVVGDIARLDRATPTLVALGYEAKGEHGIPGRRYFRKDDASGVRTHHLHAYSEGSQHVRRHLAFRDYLAEHPEQARCYGALKQQAARAHPHDIDGYMAAKAPLIEELLAEALVWYSAGR